MFLPRTSDLWPEPEMVRAFFMQRIEGAGFVGNNAAIGSGLGSSHTVILYLFQELNSGVLKSKTLKQVQGDGAKRDDASFQPTFYGHLKQTAFLQITR